MSEGLKQRIVGALVLGALGLILLPLALDFTDPKKVDRTSLIPPAPNVVATEIVVAKRPDEVADAAASATSSGRLATTISVATTLGAGGIKEVRSTFLGSVKSSAKGNRIKPRAPSTSAPTIRCFKPSLTCNLH